MSYENLGAWPFPPQISQAASQGMETLSTAASSLKDAAEKAYEGSPLDEIAKGTGKTLIAADKWARGTGYAPGSALGMQGEDKPYLPPAPTSSQKNMFWKNSPFTVVNYMLWAHVDFFPVLLKRLVRRTGRKSVTIQVPGAPASWDIRNVAKMRGNAITIDLRPFSSDSLVSLSIKVIAWLFCCASSVFFEVNRMIFLLPTGKMGPLGAAPVAAGGGGAGAGAATAPEVGKAAAQKGGEGLSFWGLVKPFGPTIIRQLAQMILCQTQPDNPLCAKKTGASGQSLPQFSIFGAGSSAESQMLAATASLEASNPGAFAEGSGRGKGSSSSFPFVPVAAGAVGVSLLFLFLLKRKRRR